MLVHEPGIGPCRNYDGIIGVWDDPVAAIHLNVGKQGEVNIVWDDPTGERVATHTIKLEANWFVTYHKPKFDRPICPGVWNTRVELADGSSFTSRLVHGLDLSLNRSL